MQWNWIIKYLKPGNIENQHAISSLIIRRKRAKMAGAGLPEGIPIIRSDQILRDTVLTASHAAADKAPGLIKRDAAIDADMCAVRPARAGELIERDAGRLDAAKVETAAQHGLGEPAPRREPHAARVDLQRVQHDAQRRQPAEGRVRLRLVLPEQVVEELGVAARQRAAEACAPLRGAQIDGGGRERLAVEGLVGRGRGAREDGDGEI